VVYLTWIEHHGLMADGHDLDPDEVLASAQAALAADTDLKPLARREALPLTALPVEAWWSDSAAGFVQEDIGDARPVTVVNLSDGIAVAAAASARNAGREVFLAVKIKEEK